MGDFVQFTVNGVAAGFVIALLAQSVVIVYRSTRVLSFAQGAIASLSTYLYYQFSGVWRWPVLAAFLVALVAAMGIGALAELLVMRPLVRADTLTRTVATLGLVLVLQVVMRVVWRGRETFAQPLASGDLSVAGVAFGRQQLITALLATAAAAALWWWTRATYAGLGLSAVAEDRDAARLLGVAPQRASTLTWAIAALLAAMAGILVTPLLVLNTWQLTLIMVTSYGAALMGGFMSLPLAMGGGLLIGVVQNLTTGYVSVSGLSESFGFIAVFVVLLATRGRRGPAVVRTGGAGI